MLKSAFYNERLLSLYHAGRSRDGKNNEGDLVQKLFRLLIESVPEKLTEMEVILAYYTNKKKVEQKEESPKDWEVLIRHPHSLKSSFANLGLNQVSVLWQELEKMAKENDFAKSLEAHLVKIIADKLENKNEDSNVDRNKKSLEKGPEEGPEKRQEKDQEKCQEKGQEESLEKNLVSFQNHYRVCRDASLEVVSEMQIAIKDFPTWFASLKS